MHYPVYYNERACGEAEFVQTDRCYEVTVCCQVKSLDVFRCYLLCDTNMVLIGVLEPDGAVLRLHRKMSKSCFCKITLNDTVRVVIETNVENIQATKEDGAEEREVLNTDEAANISQPLSGEKDTKTSSLPKSSQQKNIYAKTAVRIQKRYSGKGEYRAKNNAAQAESKQEHENRNITFPLGTGEALPYSYALTICAVEKRKDGLYAVLDERKLKEHGKKQ